jgi:hypothetical protein
MKKHSNRIWLMMTMATAGVATAAVGASAPRNTAPMPVMAQTYAISELPLPALDRMVARLAAEARTVAK